MTGSTWTSGLDRRAQNLIASGLSSASIAALLAAVASVVGHHPTPSSRLALEADSSASSQSFFVPAGLGKKLARVGRLLALVLAIIALPSSALAEGDSTPSALLLLKASEQGNQAGLATAAARALREPFESVGIRFLDSASAAGGEGNASSGLPFTDAQALTKARAAGAEICVVVGIAVHDKGKIRATTLLARAANLRLRVLEVKSGEVIVDTRTHRFGYDQDPALASGAAIVAAISALPLKKPLRARFGMSLKAAGEALTLTIQGAEGWRPVASVLKQLAGSRGMRSVHALEIDSSRVRLSILTSMSTASLVASLRRTRIAGGSVAVLHSGSKITMTLRMSPNG